MMRDMPELEIPANLLRAAGRQNAAGQAAWLSALPSTVARMARRFDLEVGRPYQPGGMTSWVAPARTSTGDRVVLKIGWRHDEALHEADGLRSWQGAGAVLLLDATTSGESNVLVLERCDPGTSLSGVPPPDQDVIVAGLLRRLWVEPGAGHPFRTLDLMCASWARSFEGRWTAGGSALDPGVVRAGIAAFRGLPGTAERSVLLCTDCHAGNILAAEREPWLMIDPKPFVGDPTYDPLQHMRNSDRLLTDPFGLVRRMAELLELDTDRLRQWLFARCVIESLDHPEWHGTIAVLAP